jgi:crotonobetainyl-CoA:carnitine CoA-transferase CaiB-like acyl-CoA transferase
MMSLTGAPEGEPTKVGIGIADIMCGMYASVGILAALRHRDQGGGGQYIDLGLLDTQVAWLTYEGLNYLTSGSLPKRVGNQHPNVVPYDVLPASDGSFILAVGNDAQFARFCDFAGAPGLAEDPRFATNANRVRNRTALYEVLPGLTAKKPAQVWLDGLTERGVPCGPVNTLDQVFADPQVRHREMQVSVPYPGAQGGEIDLIGNPIKYSKTPVAYDRPPPRLGEHTAEVLEELLDLSPAEVAALRESGAI